MIKEADESEEAIIWDFVYLPEGLTTLAKIKEGILGSSRNIEVVEFWELPRAWDLLVKYDRESHKDCVISPEACLAKYAPKKQKMTEEKE